MSYGLFVFCFVTHQLKLDQKGNFKSIYMKHPKVNESLKIEAPASEIWNRIKSFDRVEDYAGGMITRSEVKGNGIGCERTCTMNSEQGEITIKEVITEFNDSERYLKYLVQNPPMPVTNMENSISIKELVNGSEVTWQSFFDSDGSQDQEIISMLQSMIQMSLEGIKKLF